MNTAAAPPQPPRPMVMTNLSTQKQLPDCFSYDAFVVKLFSDAKSKRALVRVKGLDVLPPALVVDTISQETAAQATVPAIAEVVARGVKDQKVIAAAGDPALSALWNAKDANKVRMPLYEHVTADRRVVRFNAAECRFQVGSQWTTAYVRLTTPLYLCNGCVVSVSCNKDDAWPAQECIFARVANCSLGMSKKDGKVYWNCKAIEDGPFANVNILAPFERVQLEFGDQPIIAPDVAQLLPFAPSDWETVPLPIGLLFINRDTTASINFAKEYANMPLIINADAPSAASGPQVYIAQQPKLELKVDSTGKLPDIVNLTLALAVWDPATGLQFRTKQMILHESQLVTAGAVHPRTLYALLQNHPVPLQLMVAVDAAATAADADNSGRPGPSVQSDNVDGYVTLGIKRASFALREYLEQGGGIEVTSKSLVERYGSETSISPFIPEDFTDATGVVEMPGKNGTKWPRDPLINPYASVNEPSGVLALDEFRGAVPRNLTKAYKLYALPLMQMPDYDREAVRKMTPEQGDAFVLKYRRPDEAIGKNELADLGEELAEHAPWLQPADRSLAKKRVPIFLFFAVKRDVARATPAHVSRVQREPAPVRPEDAAKLPANASVLRSNLLQAKYQPVAPVPAPAPAPSLKREREEDMVPAGNATTPAEIKSEEPAAKRPRLEDEQAQPQQPSSSSSDE